MHETALSLEFGHGFTETPPSDFTMYNTGVKDDHSWQIPSHQTQDVDQEKHNLNATALTTQPWQLSSADHSANYLDYKCIEIAIKGNSEFELCFPPQCKVFLWRQMLAKIFVYLVALIFSLKFAFTFLFVEPRWRTTYFKNRKKKYQGVYYHGLLI